MLNNIKVTLIKDGPMILEGELLIQKESGEIIRSTNRTVLCRCGASESKPFCDGSHKNIEFKASNNRNSFA